ncbi:MAG TPA: glycosyltransferase family 2 protein [Chthoniobacterales bacterium]|jgi:glycosyltransferase involved in cell wall biosynthesis|nr:glycosyltransferase family 2 protein [Chthoniobacterales bacterium]
MESDSKALISVVIPLYNEAVKLPSFLAAVNREVGMTGCRSELILIDDGSEDSTWTTLMNEAATFPSMQGIKLSRNFGKESALCAGLDRARGDAVIVMDGDGQHPPELIPELVRLWQTSNADIVEAVKTTRGPESVSGRLGALLFYFGLNKLAGVNLKGVSDFKLMNRRAINAWLQMEERNVFFRGMTAWLGFTRVQVPFDVPARAGGATGWSFAKRMKLALTGISAFSWLPLQFVTLAGFFFFFFSILFGFYTLILQLTGRSVSGFATVILLLLIIGSLLMLSLGIIGEYLARIYEEVKRRPRYVVANVIEAAHPSSGARSS